MLKYYKVKNKNLMSTIRKIITTQIIVESDKIENTEHVWYSIAIRTDNRQSKLL